MQIPDLVMAVVWFVLAGVVSATVGWIGNTLLRIRRALDESVELLLWLKEEHQRDDSKFSTTRVIPLLEQATRLAHGTMDTMRWLAKEQTGKTPPPSGGGE